MPACGRQALRLFARPIFFSQSRKGAKRIHTTFAALRLCERILFFQQTTDTCPPRRIGRPLIAVVLRLKRTLHLYADVLRLVFGKGVELYAQLGQVQEGNLLVQVLGKYVYARCVALVICPQL